MSEFKSINGQLYCENVPVENIAKKEGTPLYVYSEKSILSRFRLLDDAFSEIPHLICYSVKCNSNISVLKLLAEQGAGFDIVSGGELFRVSKAGGDTSKVVFAGVGKSEKEITFALEKDIKVFTVESEQELERINSIAEKIGRKARIAMRVNPNVDPQTHKYISTGKKENKFGLDIKRAKKAYDSAMRLPAIEPVGIQIHIGSQILKWVPFAEAIDKMIPLIKELQGKGVPLEFFDIGGGLGIVYKDEKPQTAQEFADIVVPRVKPLNLTLIMEPGRFIMGNSGILVTSVEYVKESGDKTFVIVDSALNDLIRPALYDAYHHIIPVKGNGNTVRDVDVVGPICESGDFFAKDRPLPLPAEKDLLAIKSVGAYGFTMASNYNSRTRSAEVLVSGGSYKIIRRRESWEDLIRHETNLREGSHQ